MALQGKKGGKPCSAVRRHCMTSGGIEKRGQEKREGNLPSQEGADAHQRATVYESLIKGITTAEYPFAVRCDMSLDNVYCKMFHTF